MRARLWIKVGMLLLLLVPAARAADNAVSSLAARIKAVGREGAGNAEAAKAWQELVKLGPTALPDILEALDDADPRAANWLRAAVDAIAERELTAGRMLPAARLEAFVKDTRHSGQGRRLAFEWLTRADKTAPDRLIPGMANDPSVELRRDAIARLIAEVDNLAEKDKTAAAVAYRKVLVNARDTDQVNHLAKQLALLGDKVDLAGHYGFIQKWLVIGPFDNVKKIGFDAVYPPEKGIDLKATYTGKDGAKLSWQPYATADSLGVVDLNKVIAKHMGAVGYAYTVIESAKEQPVQIRAGSNNAVKMWLNGKPIYFRDEYHHGMRMDQHTARAELKAGRNEILIKVCQNEQTDNWAQKWDFQLRVCDALGGMVPFTVATDKVAGRSAEKEVRP